MNPYAPPLSEMLFALQVAERLSPYPGSREISGSSTHELSESVLSAAGRLAVNELAPLHRLGDIHGTRLESGRPQFPPGFKETYDRYVQGGWSTVAYNEKVGGQGLPYPLATAVAEIWGSANTVFGLLFMPMGGAIALLDRFGSQAQRRLYLPKLVSGEWTATMAMTEPQAGTDLGAIRCRAVPVQGGYRLFGEKSFISFADHDLVPNVLQFVLARTPDAPPGTRGLTLFLVPTTRVSADGQLTTRNDVRYLSLEHKLGLRGMPTGTLIYGETDGADAQRIGEEHRGIECMFTLMNRARLSIGLLGLASAERAFQAARGYARDRVQGRALGGTGAGPVTIVHHPDVRRMLLSMKARIDAMRLLAYFTANLVESAEALSDPAPQKAVQARLDLMTPIVKAWLTETAFDTVSTAVQIHGGLGYMEEAGLAQLLREARVHPIYEGTTGVQAMDLVGRKLARDGGATAKGLLSELSSIAGELERHADASMRHCVPLLTTATRALEQATDWMARHFADNPQRALAGSVPYLDLFARVAGGWLLARAALLAGEVRAANRYPDELLRAKAHTARFFADHYLAGAAGWLHTITEGGDAVVGPAIDWI